MKKFQFRLERILQYRESIQEQKQKALLAARLRLQEAEDEQAHLLAARESNELIASEEGLALQQLYGKSLILRLRENGQVREKLAQEVAQAQQEYIVASQEVEVLSSLRKKQHAEYLHILSKEEDKAIDEMVTQRWVPSRKVRNHEET